MKFFYRDDYGYYAHILKPIIAARIRANGKGQHHDARRKAANELLNALMRYETGMNEIASREELEG